MVAKAIRDQLFALSPEERLSLAEELWESLIDEAPSLVLSDEHRLIFDERLRDHEANPHDVQSWDEVKVQASSALAEHRRRAAGERKSQS